MLPPALPLLRGIVRYGTVGMLALGLLLLGLLVGITRSRVTRAGETAAESHEDRLDFNRDIRPILSDHCLACHGPDVSHRQAGLRLDLADSAKLALASGATAVVPGEPSQSELIRRITTTDHELRMPPTDAQQRPLSAAQVQLLTRWIEQGAEFAGHWSLQPLRRALPPRVRKADWTRNPIDAFVLERLEKRGWHPAEEADRVTLLRRLWLDLAGLPPTPELVEAFIHDADPLAYERQVEALLASIHFGERMAISWLDLVRYADSVGYHGDQETSNTPYRDYVIRAFNQNLSYDQFTHEQLAGDLLPDATLSQRIASGYNRLNQTTEEGGAQAKEYLAIYFADRIRNLSAVWLGMTVGCAQCHDHKYDPITSHDFYSMGAFFADLEERGVYGNDGHRPPTIALPTPNQAAEMATVEAEIARYQQKAPKPEDLQGDDKAAWDKLHARKTQLQGEILTAPVSKAVEPRPVRVLPRGDWLSDAGPLVSPAIPAVFGSLAETDRRPTRLDLAEWFTSPDTMGGTLASRTFVNRMWRHCFGNGLSNTLDDFGSQGEVPIHLDLLDWLARHFINSQWDVKQLVRTIVTSATYRQSSLPNHDYVSLDPENRFWSRQSRYRMDAELIRDQALTVSGLLVRRLGGRSGHPYQPPGYWDQLNFPQREYVPATGEGQYRRGVYTHWQRTFLHPMLKAFDAPSREECTAARPRSNTPLAALNLLNDPTFVEAARVLADRVVHEGGTTPQDRVRWAHRQVLLRNPHAEVEKILTELYHQERSEYTAHPDAARELLGVGQAAPGTSDPVETASWTAVTRVLLNVHETITRN